MENKTAETKALEKVKGLVRENQNKKGDSFSTLVNEAEMALTREKYPLCLELCRQAFRLEINSARVAYRCGKDMEYETQVGKLGEIWLRLTYRLNMVDI